MSARIYRKNNRTIVDLVGVSVDRRRYTRIELDILKAVGWMSVSAFDPAIDGYHFTQDERFPDFTEKQIHAIVKVLNAYTEPTVKEV